MVETKLDVTFPTWQFLIDSINILSRLDMNQGGFIILPQGDFILKNSYRIYT